MHPKSPPLRQHKARKKIQKEKKEQECKRKKLGSKKGLETLEKGWEEGYASHWLPIRNSHHQKSTSQKPRGHLPMHDHHVHMEWSEIFTNLHYLTCSTSI